MTIHCKQLGIGLLELMLAMSITAILILASIQYFGANKRAAYVSAAVQEIHAIMQAVNGMSQPKKVAERSKPDGVTSDWSLTRAVILSGAIPRDYIGGIGTTSRTLHGPWGRGEGDATFTITYHEGTVGSGNRSYVTIYGVNLPDYGCQSLATQFSGGENMYGEPECTIDSQGGSNNTLTINFFLARSGLGAKTLN